MFQRHRGRFEEARDKAEKLDRRKRREAEAKGTHGRANGRPQELTKEQEEKLFGLDKVAVEDDAKGSSSEHPMRSRLGEMEASGPRLVGNPFQKYLRCDEANVPYDQPVKRLEVFFVGPGQDGNYPLALSVWEGATVLDVIGLSCYRYSEAAAGKPALVHGEPEYYDLRAHREEVPTPARMEHYDPIGKYGFRRYELVETGSRPEPVEVVCHLPNDSPLLVAVDGKDIRMDMELEEFVDFVKKE